MNKYLKFVLKAVVISLVVYWWISSVHYFVNKPTKKDLVIDSLKKEIRYYKWKDSLYWIHISKCSFIENNQIEVGFGDYIKLTASSKPEE